MVVKKGSKRAKPEMDLLDELCHCGTMNPGIPYYHSLRVHWLKTINGKLRRREDTSAA